MTIFLSIRFCNAKMEQRLWFCYSRIQMTVASSLLFAVLQQRNFTRFHTFCLRLARCRQIQRPVECLIIYYHNLQDKLIDQFFGYRKRRGIYPAIQRPLNCFYIKFAVLFTGIALFQIMQLNFQLLTFFVDFPLICQKLFARNVAKRTHFTKPFGEPIRYGNYIAQLGNMLTGGGVMVQRLGDLLLGRRTDESRLAKSTTRPTLKTAVPGDLSFVLPHRHLTSIIEAMRAFDKLAPGLYSRNTLLYGVEVKFYSSKVNVNNRFETSVSGLYAIGDGAGITRGLMQASVTGVCVARDIKKSCK